MIQRRRDELKVWLVQRVSQELKVPTEEIDVEESVLALGIDSLALIGLSAELAEFLQVEVDVEVIYEHDSINKIARYYSSDVEVKDAELCRETEIVDVPENYPSERRLRILRRGSDKSPVISVGFPNLAYLLEQKIDSHSPVGWLQLDDSVLSESVRPPDEMAADFSAEIKKVYPDSSVTLVGFSYGGTVAYEVGCQLEAMGIRVRLLLLEPASWQKEGWRDKIWSHSRIIRKLRLLGWPSYLGSKAAIFSSQVVAKLSSNQLAEPSNNNTDISSNEAWKRSKIRIAHSFRNYIPHPFSGVVAIGGRSSWLDRHSYIWERMIRPRPTLFCLDQASRHDDVRFGVGAEKWTQLLNSWRDDSISCT